MKAARSDLLEGGRAIRAFGRWMMFDEHSLDAEAGGALIADAIHSIEVIANAFGKK